MQLFHRSPLISVHTQRNEFRNLLTTKFSARPFILDPYLLASFCIVRESKYNIGLFMYWEWYKIQCKYNPKRCRYIGPLTHSIVACRSGTLFCCCSPGLYAAGSPPAGWLYIIVLCAGCVTGLCLDCTSFSLDEGRASGMSDSEASWNYKTLSNEDCCIKDCFEETCLRFYVMKYK